MKSEEKIKKEIENNCHKINEAKHKARTANKINAESYLDYAMFFEKENQVLQWVLQNEEDEK